MITFNLLAWQPFIDPLPVWNYWYLLLFPLCLGVSVVYKAARIDDMRQVPKQAVLITAWIIGGMGLAALALALIVQIL